MSRRIFDKGVVVDEQEIPQDAIDQQREQNHAQLFSDAFAALEVNRQLGEQNQAVIDAAGVIGADQAIQSYDAAGKTANQVLADVLAGLKSLDRQVKQVAQGVAIMARHDQEALVQRNALIRLVVGAYEATD